MRKLVVIVDGEDVHIIQNNLSDIETVKVCELLRTRSIAHTGRKSDMFNKLGNTTVTNEDAICCETCYFYKFSNKDKCFLCLPGYKGWQPKQNRGN